MMRRWIMPVICSILCCRMMGGETDVNLLKVNLGVEFPGTQATYQTSAGGGKLELDFSQGGQYAGLERQLKDKFDRLETVTIKLQTEMPLLQFRVKDSAGRFYQRNYVLSGNGAEEQTIKINRFFGDKSQFNQWGNGAEGSFCEPVENYYLIFPKAKIKQTVAILSLQEFGKEKICISGAKAPARYRITPGSIFRLPLSDIPAAEKREVILRDYSGNKVLLPTPAVWNKDNSQLEITVPKERGFYELSLPQLQLTCGIIVAPELSGKKDPYFAIDTALGVFGDYASDVTRKEALQLLTKCGISTIRDRIVWSALENKRGVFDFRASPPLPVNQNEAWETVKQSGCRVLNVFHDAPLWTGSKDQNDAGSRYPYPQDLVGTAESWKKIAAQRGEIWDALEVWNEPEIGFGNSLPGDRVAAVQHTISYAFAKAGYPIKISGGVFTGYQRSPDFFDSYIDNGVFDDADLFSLHDYLEPEHFENLISAHRQMLAKTTQPGIPIWITECGLPWRSTKDRAELEEDRCTATAIAGKSFEGKACGVERIFMFVYSFYQEGFNRKNFGMCDKNFTPQRSFAAYAFSAEILAGKEYVGDISIEGTIRSRAFSDGKNGIVAVYDKTGKKELRIPQNLKIDEVYDIDGRKLPVPDNGGIVAKNSVLYLKVSDSRLRPLLNSKTTAMELYRIAKRKRSTPRPIHPVVFQNRIDTSKYLHRLNGYLIPEKEFQFDFSAHNLSDETITIKPNIAVPDAAVISCNWQDTVDIPPKSELMLHCTLDSAKLFHAGDRTKAVVSDSANNTANLTVPLLNWKFSLAPARFLDHSVDNENWITIGDWMPWASDIKNPNISAQFRLGWNDKFLRIEVMVNDRDLNQPYPQEEAWKGDSVQIGFQKLNNGKPDMKGSTEITAATTANGPVLFRHLSQNRTGQNEVLKTSKLEFTNKNNQHHYIIDLSWSELGVSQVKENDIFGLSLLINSNAGKGRCGVLYWGEGIAVSKTPSEYNQLQLQK